MSDADLINGLRAIMLKGKVSILDTYVIEEAADRLAELVRCDEQRGPNQLSPERQVEGGE